MGEQRIESAKEHFGELLGQQLERIEYLKTEAEWADFSTINPIIIGILGGAGIGPNNGADYGSA